MKKRNRDRSICLKCGPSKFKTVSKAAGTHACRRCGTVTTEK